MNSIADTQIIAQDLDLEALHQDALRAVVKHGSASDLFRFIRDMWGGDIEAQVAVCNAALKEFSGLVCPTCKNTRYIVVQCSIDSGPCSQEWEEAEACPSCCCSDCGGLKDSAYCLCLPSFADEMPL